jgi:hypothetical protein
MADMRRHLVALAAAAWIIVAMHASAQSSDDDRWFFGAIEWCAAGNSNGRTYVRPRGSGMDFHVLAAHESGELHFPGAFVFPLSGDECDAVSLGDPREGALRYLQYVNAGFRLAPGAVHVCKVSALQRCDADNSRTVVLARSLNERAIVDAVTNRRVYASTDKNLGVRFSINAHPLGSVTPMAAGTPLRIEVRLSDPDEPSASYWVSLRHDEVGGPVEADRELSGTDLKGNGTIVFTQFRRGAHNEYFLLEVTQGAGAEADVVWTAPIWLVSVSHSSLGRDAAHGQ